MLYWHKRVTTSVDSNGGIISLKVAAFDPQESYTLTRALLDESERMVNELSLKAVSRRSSAFLSSRVLSASAALRALRLSSFTMRSLSSRSARVSV
jgi:capsular polysaccharide transport system permease protein